MLVIAVIHFDFCLHDALLSDTSLILSGIRYREAKCFYYDSSASGFDYQALAAAPVYRSDSDYNDLAAQAITQNAEAYYREHRLNNNSTLSETPLSAVITIGNNADIIQAGGRAVEFIGEVLNK